MYLLDSSVCIDYMRHRDSGALDAFIARVGPARIFLCSIVVSELLAGACASQQPTIECAKVEALRRLFRSLPFDDVAAETAGRTFADLRSNGVKIGYNDLLIASIAIVNDLIILTGNLREFRRISRLRAEDPASLIRP